MVSENSYSAEKGLYNPVSKDSVQKECWILSNVCEHSGLYSFIQKLITVVDPSNRPLRSLRINHT